jgi:SAM-dependent methyltransferase
VTTRDEEAARERFAEQYSRRDRDVYRVMERAVIGGDWGANGYTTVEEADELGRLLALRPGVLLLDVGCGTGWPGLYLSVTTGCDLLATDLPLEGLAAGKRRAATEVTSGRTAFAAASAGRFPLRQSSVDAVVHTDVLC